MIGLDRNTHIDIHVVNRGREVVREQIATGPAKISDGPLTGLTDNAGRTLFFTPEGRYDGSGGRVKQIPSG